MEHLARLTFNKTTSTSLPRLAHRLYLLLCLSYILSKNVERVFIPQNFHHEVVAERRLACCCRRCCHRCCCRCCWELRENEKLLIFHICVKCRPLFAGSASGPLPFPPPLTLSNPSPRTRPCSRATIVRLRLAPMRSVPERTGSPSAATD